MRELRVDAFEDLVTLDALFVLQLHTGNELLLPRLGVFECEAVSGAFVPFLPLFLSPKTVKIDLKFAANAPTFMLASTIARFSKLCPNIQYLLLDRLPRHQIITDVVSELALACNRDTLQCFGVDSPLTEEARRFLHTLPDLRRLWAVIQGPMLLSPVVLPNLRQIFVEWDSGRDWLQGFRGATFGKLERITFQPPSGSAQTDGFLEDFQRVALATSLQNTLSEFSVWTSQPWNPNYSSLLIFNQMEELEIEFSCHNGCSSTVNDDIVTSLARAMPKLEILRLGKAPCSALTGVTLRGLVALAGHCPQLSELRIHIQAGELGEAAATGIELPRPSGNAAVILRTDCALTVLQVGEAPIPQEVVLAVAQTLLEVFPQIHNIEYTEPLWESVVEIIERYQTDQRPC